MPASVSPVRSPSAMSALSGLLSDLDRLFVPPPPLPDVAARVGAVLRQIDWSGPLIVLWVPGTNTHGVPRHVAAGMARLLGAGIRAVHIPYQSTWRFRDSVPDGEAVLAGVMRGIARRRRRGQRVVLLGESQGAWIISSVLRDAALARLVERAALIAHPGTAPSHVHATSRGKGELGRFVREFNNPRDIATRDPGVQTERVVDMVDAFARLEMGRALRHAVSVLTRDPAVVQALVASQLFRLQGTANPHDSESVLTQALRWAFEPHLRRDRAARPAPARP